MPCFQGQGIHILQYISSLSNHYLRIRCGCHLPFKMASNDWQIITKCCIFQTHYNTRKMLLSKCMFNQLSYQSFKHFSLNNIIKILSCRKWSDSRWSPPGHRNLHFCHNLPHDEDVRMILVSKAMFQGEGIYVWQYFVPLSHLSLRQYSLASILAFEMATSNYMQWIFLKCYSSKLVT